jgi:diaminohydroxyphosphoribosylaminopyrimidine deaminase/5-amino-6-(5-phosphoribosylamino)uracil reductase
VIADSRFNIDPQSAILKPVESALVFGCVRSPAMDALKDQGVECVVVEDDGNGRVSLVALLAGLAERNINEVQVEAGGTLCGALLSQGLVDEILLYQAPRLLGVDAPPAFAIGPLETIAQGVHLEVREVVRTGLDLRIRIVPKKDR